MLTETRQTGLSLWSPDRFHQPLTHLMRPQGQPSLPSCLLSRPCLRHQLLLLGLSTDWRVAVLPCLVIDILCPANILFTVGPCPVPSPGHLTLASPYLAPIVLSWHWYIGLGWKGPQKREPWLPHGIPFLFQARLPSPSRGPDRAIARHPCTCVLAKLFHPCLTLCNLMYCSWPISSVHGIFQARILEWVAISFSRQSSQPRDQTHIASLTSPALAEFFITQFSQFSSSVVSDSLQPHGLQHASQASLSITESRSLLKLMPIELVVPPVVFITGATCTWGTTGYIKVCLPFLVHE